MLTLPTLALTLSAIAAAAGSAGAQTDGTCIPEAERARGPRSTVVESYGKVWLFTIDAAEWRPAGGTRVQRVGPLPLVKADTIAAVMDQRAGDPGLFVADGLPMRLTGTGTGIRRSLVLILQDSTKPRSTPAPDWTPRGLCR